MRFRLVNHLKPPYDLPSLPSLDHPGNNPIDRRNIQQFLRIEGLLRSPKVWALYQKSLKTTAKKRRAPQPNNPDLLLFLFGRKLDAQMNRLLWDTSLQTLFNVEDGWAVLLGSHHRYLKPRNIPFRIGEGIVDLSILHKSRDLSFKLDYLEQKQSRYLYVMIDSAEVSLSDLRELQNLLQKRQQEYSGSVKLIQSLDIQDIQAWLRYLQCYDAHKYNEKSAAEVASIIYNPPSGDRLTKKERQEKNSSRRQVVRACQQVKRLITRAEKGAWIFNPL